jgi:hypothetical protein
LVLDQYAPTRPQEDDWIFDLSSGQILGKFHCTKSFPSPDKSWVASIEEFGANCCGPSQSDEIDITRINENTIDHLVINGEGESAHPDIDYADKDYVLEASPISDGTPSWYWKVFSNGLWSEDSHSVWFAVGEKAFRQVVSQDSSGLHYRKYLLAGLVMPSENIKEIKTIVAPLGLGGFLNISEKKLAIEDEFIEPKKAISWTGKNELKVLIDEFPFENVKKDYLGKKMIVTLPSKEGS